MKKVLDSLYLFFYTDKEPKAPVKPALANKISSSFKSAPRFSVILLWRKLVNDYRELVENSK